MTCERVTGITRRYIWRDSSLPVTQRYTIAAPEMPAAAPLSVTQHYVWQAPENERSRVGQFNQGVLLADRYRILSGPLGESSGEGEVYCCQDEERAQKVAVKLYHGQNAPKQSVIEQLQGLVHPYIVRLQDYGQWQGQFYEVMDYCTGGVLSDVMPLTEDELEALIPGLVQALRFCHEQGIIHRDLKPNNLFFNNLDDGILLGDFGISSYLEKSAAQVTQTFHHLTLDYAAPELLDGHVVSDKTDYYALGLTLVHILLGASPFSGQSNNEILVAHLRGRIPLPKTLSSRWRSLIRGLTHLQPEVRWGYRQVMAWLQEEPIPLAASLHPAPTSRSTPSGMPSRSKADTSNTDHHSHAYPDTTSARYPGFPEASTPAQLARNLDRFEAMEQLIKGDIRRWLFDFISPVMAGAVDDLAACVSPDELSGTSGLEAQILMRLRYILDPDTSLIVEGETIDNLTQLANLAKHADRSKISSLDATLWRGEIEAWIAAKERAGNRTNELLSRISAIRQRLSQTGHPRVALFALRYTLDPQQPLHLFSRYSITHPHDLGALFSRPSSALHGVVKKLIFGRYFEEWIRAAEFPGWENDIRFIEDARLRYLDSKDVGVYSVIWHYSPDVPLPFQGHA
ncbi:MAG: serine/threonine protein kinase, partial [Pseudomonadales bacterium]|nr:serine/threonine protein kinase [Pseudomonadales bacterium]